MTGDKAVMLEGVCEELGHPFVRFDFTACGESSGDPLDVSMTRWKNDALAVVDKLTSGPLVIVGSSLGSWLMLLVALERINRIQGLLGLAAAPDFLLSRAAALEASAGDALARDGFVKYPDVVHGPYTVSKHMLEDAKRNSVLKGNVLQSITCPVRLIHGLADDVVPFRVSLDLSEKLTGTNDVDIILRKTGGHRLNEKNDLELIKKTLVETFLS